VAGTLRWLTVVATTLALLAVLAWGGAVGYLWFNETSMVFRTQFSRRSGLALDPAMTPVRLRTADGVDLQAATLADQSRRDAFWLLYFQGNAGSLRRSRVQQHLHAFRDLGYNVLSLDYRGYGLSAGEPSEQGLYEDGLAAYHYLREAGVDPGRIVLGGQSLGSAVAVELATRVASGGLALFSPIDSVPMTASRLYPFVPAHLLARNRFDSAAKVGRLQVPIVVFHSDTDRLIPLSAARALFGAITSPKLMIETAGGHNGAGFADPGALRQAMFHFWPNGLEPALDGEEVVGAATAGGAAIRVAP
jgi:uncharacterized protein